jgi:hypothetical protein
MGWLLHAAERQRLAVIAAGFADEAGFLLQFCQANMRLGRGRNGKAGFQIALRLAPLFLDAAQFGQGQ